MNEKMDEFCIVLFYILFISEPKLLIPENLFSRFSNCFSVTLSGLKSSISSFFAWLNLSLRSLDFNSLNLLINKMEFVLNRYDNMSTREACLISSNVSLFPAYISISSSSISLSISSKVVSSPIRIGLYLNVE